MIFIRLLLVTSLSIVSFGFLNNQDEPEPIQVLVIGDSFIEGVGAENNYGWAERLRDSSATIEVTVDGMSGRNAKDTLKRLKQYPIHAYEYIVVAVGINDSRFHANTSSYFLHIDTYRRKLLKIVSLFDDEDTTVIFIGLTRVDETFTTPIASDVYYYNESIDRYDHMLQTVSDLTSVQYVSVPPLNDRIGLLSDGLHPSDEGHEVLFQAIRHQLIFNRH